MSFLLYQTFMGIDEEALQGQSRLDFILSYWGKADKLFFFLSGFVAISSHVLRAVRWKTVLEPLGYKNISTFNATNAVLNGYFINLFIPRGGELSRPVSLEKTEGVPTEVGVGTVVTERVIDLIFLVLCMGAAFIFQADKILGIIYGAIDEMGGEPIKVEEGFSIKLIVLLIVILGLLGVGALFFIKKDLFGLLKGKAIEFLKGMKLGVFSIFKLEKRVQFIILSLAIWAGYYLMMYLVFKAYEETEAISLADTLAIFIVGGIAMAIPLPGGTGSYHKMVPFALITLCGVAPGPATAIVTIFHGFQTALLAVFGGLSLYFIFKNTKKKDVEQG